MPVGVAVLDLAREEDQAVVEQGAVRFLNGCELLEEIGEFPDLHVLIVSSAVKFDGWF